MWEACIRQALQAAPTWFRLVLASKTSRIFLDLHEPLKKCPGEAWW